MNMTTCSCPNCRSGAGEFEFELYGVGETEILSENEEMELAMELLSVGRDQELEQFLGNLMKSVGRGLSSAGKFVSKNVLPVVGPALKQLAKTALPMAGAALGSFIPIPGVGTMIGQTLGQAAANALEMETAGMEPEQADIEKARRFVKIAAAAIADASDALQAAPAMPGTASAQQIADTAVTAATQRFIPGIATPAPRRPAFAPASTGARSAPGRWWRRGNILVIEGV
jgi:hypothetical protein